jgi:hypothetical protein
MFKGLMIVFAALAATGVAGSARLAHASTATSSCLIDATIDAISVGLSKGTLCISVIPDKDAPAKLAGLLIEGIDETPGRFFLPDLQRGKYITPYHLILLRAPGLDASTGGTGQVTYLSADGPVKVNLSILREDGKWIVKYDRTEVHHIDINVGRLKGQSNPVITSFEIRRPQDARSAR